MRCIICRDSISLQYSIWHNQVNFDITSLWFLSRLPSPHYGLSDAWWLLAQDVWPSSWGHSAPRSNTTCRRSPHARPTSRPSLCLPLVANRAGLLALNQPVCLFQVTSFSFPANYFGSFKLFYSLQAHQCTHFKQLGYSLQNNQLTNFKHPVYSFQKSSFFIAS